MSNEFKVVSGSTNVLLIINGKGVPAQVTKPSDKDANEHWRFLVRDDRLSEFFPYVARLEAHETCEVNGTNFWEWEWSDYTAYYEHNLSCGHVVTTMEPEPPNFCEECGARIRKAVKR